MKESIEELHAQIGAAMTDDSLQDLLLEKAEVRGMMLCSTFRTCARPQVAGGVRLGAGRQRAPRMKSAPRLARVCRRYAKSSTQRLGCG